MNQFDPSDIDPAKHVLSLVEGALNDGPMSAIREMGRIEKRFLPSVEMTELFRPRALVDGRAMFRICFLYFAF